MSDKVITVSPEFLRVASSSTRRDKKKGSKRKNNTAVNPGRLRDKLMSRIKAFQDRQGRKHAKKGGGKAAAMAVETEPAEDPQSSFHDSVSFLEGLAKAEGGAAPQSRQRKEPAYGCLKGGKKLTYRQWKAKQGTVRSGPSRPGGHGQEPIKIVDPPAPAPAPPRVSKLQEVKARRAAAPQQVPSSSQAPSHLTPQGARSDAGQSSALASTNNNSTEPSSANRKKRVLRTLGRGAERKDGIRVLITNRRTRRRVQTEHGRLRTAPLREIKRYLRSKHLLSAGSEAPPDVVRHMYEQAMLAGDVYNRDKDTMLKSYLGDNKQA